MIVCVPVTTTGEVDPRWGRAARVGVADVRDGGIVHWEEFDVRWDELHDTGSEGSHHARVAGFLQAQGTDGVVAHHMGDPMLRMLGSMGIEVWLGASGDARSAAMSAAAAREG